LTELGDAAEALAQDPSSRAADQRARDPEFVRLHRAIDAVGRSLQDVLERERSFARYASHELRTPVGALKVQIERVELGAASAADVLPAVARQTARIEELIDALLALTRTRERRSRVQPLPKLLHESVESLGEAERNRVYFVEPVPDVLVRESVLVRQALRNLLDNAVRHGAGPVTVRIERADDALTLRVRDMGGGIPGTELRRMAEPSDRRAPRPDGHGLGLTLVALIARALDGRLLLHNTEIGLEASLTVTVVVDAGA
jgi:signal transduction histidine kinase